MCFSREYKAGMKMKIPNGGSGNGYYGHETGVIAYLDNDEPEIDIQPVTDSDFSEYMWMENEEEFDKEVLEQLEEEELMEECLEAMLEEERQHQRNQTTLAWCNAANGTDSGYELCQQLNSLRVQGDLAKQSTLNPDAAEFIPSFKTTVSPVSTTPEISSETS